MNEEMKKLQRQLERATARGVDGESELDPQTARLRDAWTALGRLLEAATADAPSLDRWAQRPPFRPRRWLVPATAALAASLLVAALAAWMWRAGNMPEKPGTAPPAATFATVKSPARQQTAETVAQRSAQVQNPRQPEPADAPAWDDALDERLAQVGQQVVRFQQDWTSQVAARAVLQYELDQVRADLTENNL